MSSTPNDSTPPSTQVIAPTPSPNPWADVDVSKPLSPRPVVAVPTPELALAQSNAFKDAVPPPTPTKSRVDSTLLNEFDPLVDKVESNAREAWASSEGHPPPPAPPPKPAQPQSQPPAIPPPDTKGRPPSTTMEPPTSAAAHVTTFTALANLARAPFARSRASSTAQQNPPPQPSTSTSNGHVDRSSPAVPAKDVATSMSPTANAVANLPATPSGDDGTGDSTKADPPFDFQKFLDQMKTKSAEPVAKYLRSFLTNFAKRTFTVNDQIKLIRDFLEFITTKMRDCEVWKHATEAEFDNAAEAMEKLVMNRLYDYTFTPQIDQVAHPVTTDDLERDHVVRQRMKLFGWVKEDHLDVPVGEGSQGFMNFAQQELLKMNHYKAPRDKLICILNCCKVIFGLIRHLQRDEGADSFLPILIFVVLKANPEHLISNVEYISRFRNPSKLQSEAGYYLSSLSGAVSFIETMDHTSLSNISQEEFESNVEAAIQALPPSPVPNDERTSRVPTSTPPRTTAQLSSANQPGDETAIPLKLPSTASLAEDTKRFLQRTGDSISKPLSAIGKIFNEAMDGLDELERQREQSRKERNESGSDMSSILSQVGPDWLFGSRPGTPATPAAGGAPVTPAAGQAPYRARVRPGSAGAATGNRTPDSTTPSSTYRHSSYQIPALNLQSSPLNLSSSLPQDSHLNATPQRSSTPQPQWLRPRPSPRLDPRTQQSLAAGSDHPDSRSQSSLNLTEMQNQIADIDRAHAQSFEVAKGTLTQMFPACDSEVIDMVLEANRNDLGSSIETLLEMMAT